MSVRYSASTKAQCNYNGISLHHTGIQEMDFYTHYSAIQHGAFLSIVVYDALDISPGGGGGGGALRYRGGRLRSLSKLKNTSKALISGHKCNPYFDKSADFFQ